MVSAKKDERPPEMTLSLEAADRKERLLALRRRKDDGPDSDALGPRYAYPFPLPSLMNLTQPFLLCTATHSHSVTGISTREHANLSVRINHSRKWSRM